MDLLLLCTMKTTEKNSPVRISGISNAGIAFGIKEDGLAHIFNVLRNQLYSNKVLAVIREYSCNAYDAHIEAGNKAPICVTCPTILSPHFIVRDYGTGLSPEQIQEIYAFYGESTKRNTNEQIGQLGLGSKSGFAYGENFVINSYCNGIRYSYNAFIDASKKGQILLMDESDTSEHNGVEIVIPVRPKDIAVFESTIISFFKHFNPKPDIVNIDYSKLKAAWEIGNVELEGEGWQYTFKRDSRHWSDSEPTMLVMGNIAYPLDSNAIDGFNNCFATNFIVQFPIGSLEVAASRESLQYSNSTQQVIKQRFAEINKEIHLLLKRRIDKAETLFEAKCIFSEIFNHGGSFSRFASFFKGSNAYSWKGKRIDDDRIYCTDNAIRNDYCVSLITKSGKSDRIINKKVENGIIKCQNGHKIYVDNVNGRFMQRLAHYVFDRTKTGIYGIYVITFANDAAKKAWLANTGVAESELKYASSEKIVKIQYVSDGESVPKDVKHNPSAEFVLDLTSDRSWFKVRSQAFKQKTFDLEAGGVYMHIDKFYCNPLEELDAQVEAPKIIQLLNDSKESLFHIDFPEIACFKAETIAKIKNNPKWKSLKQFIKDWIAENWSNQRQQIADYIYYKDFNSKVGHAKISAISKLKCDNNFRNFSEHCKEMGSWNVEAAHNLFRNAGVLQLIKADKPTYDLHSEIAQITKENPILNFIEYYNYDTNYQKFLDKMLTRYISATGPVIEASENSEKTA